MTIHIQQHIVDLVEICCLKNIKHVVISPGSRNAPLTRLFTSNPLFICHSIVDERSAAFFALGLSLGTGKPVAIICTSGTAVLNYAPAIAEAFYQKVPLIAITADRPAHLIDQQDNQTIHQANIYQNYIKESLNLEWPVINPDMLKKQHIAITQTIDASVSDIMGPVHINVPISEPLYDTLPQKSDFISIPIEKSKPVAEIENSYINSWKNAKRRMVLCGQNIPNEKLKDVIQNISENKKAVVLAEPIANIKTENCITALDRIMIHIENNEPETYQPDLLISFGGPVVSKRLKQWLQKQPNLLHWRIAENNDMIDTYQNRKALLIGNPADILKQFSFSGDNSEPSFLEKWQTSNTACFKNDQMFFKSSPFSDASVFYYILNNIPENTTLHLGNSSPVRYAQNYPCEKANAVYSNRGVSGIDGSLSTASGIATAVQGLHLILVGDLSFVYDSNALWNRNLSKNLRIVVINNGGGGIFRLLPGPSEQECFAPFIETNHPVHIEKLSAAFGLNYFHVGNQDELIQKYNTFIITDGPSLMEIKTVNTENPTVYKAHGESIKK